jgi:ABC-type Zn uptake system ZnuABC Zn-binding protein ZnuA
MVRRLFQPRGSLSRLPLLLLLIVLFSACASPTDRGSLAGSAPSDQHLTLRQPDALEPAPLVDGRHLQVVASTSIIADVVDNIGGDNLELAVLIPRGTDPHAYQPTPGDLQALYGADLILLNGFNLEADLVDVLSPVSEGVPVISLSDGLQARALNEGVYDKGIDPHVWFDPVLVSHWVDRIEQSLSRLDPAYAEEFKASASRYHDELSNLDQWIDEQVISIPAGQRKLVLDHLLLGYFADRYGFEMISALVPAFSSAAEASPRELAVLTEVILAEGVPAIFVGVDTNPNLAEQIAGDLGIEVIELYTGSLGPLGGPADSYLEMMQYNVLAIKQALGPE